MIHRLLIVLGILLPLVVFPGASHGNDPPAGLMTMDGGVADWYTYLQMNKWLLVNIWNVDCPVCDEIVHQIVELQEQRGGNDLFILGIALMQPGGQPDVDAYIVRHRVNFLNLLDDGSNVAQIYRDGTGSPWDGSTPTILLYNPQGTLVAKYIGPLCANDIIKFIDNYNE